LQSDTPDVVVIYDDGFNYLTKMCLTVMREAAFVMVRECKKRGCIVIVSSSDAADRYEKYLEQGVDYVVKGEGEITLKALIDGLEKGEDVRSLSGIVYSIDGIAQVNTPRSVLRDLDTLPFPAWDLVDISQYRSIWLKHHGYFSLNIATTRGCPFKCNWCAKPIYGNRYTSRSPAHVVKEIEFLKREFSPDHFWISDDIFGLKPGWVAEFRALVNAKGLKFRFKIQSRVDLLLEEETLNDLVRAGVDTVWVGAESGSQSVLDGMEKGTTVAEIYAATKRMKEKKIKVGFFLQFGYPGESRNDIDATLKMLLELMPDEVGISISYPLPGTGFYEKVKGQLREKQNWTHSDDLMPMFQSTFSNSYYKELHRYVHTVYQKHKGYRSLQKLFYHPLRLTLKELKSGIATLYYLPDSIVKRLRLKSFEFESKN
jgi:anaerobic magnesium-protoporphyrin IX monomethyl ester cyclase